MPIPVPRTGTPLAELTDGNLVQAVVAGDTAAFETLMRRHNARLFRVARAVLKDDADAEDALQDAYIDAYSNARAFRGDAQPGTWLTRIVVNRALMRLRSQKRHRIVVPFGTRGTGERDDVEATVADERAESPSNAALRAEVRRILERRIDGLPTAFRAVFVMREVEGMSVEETAQCLSIPPSTVRTRLFRARALLREGLEQDMDMATGDVFAFAGARCDRIVAAVLGRIAGTSAAAAASNPAEGE
jgi:RNA polymerase sigma-70 factor (ECF subfamily)